jgi:hypothetical protein
MLPRERRKGMSPGGGSTGKVNLNTGQMMNLLEDQDWALCDEECSGAGIVMRVFGTRFFLQSILITMRRVAHKEILVGVYEDGPE